MTQPPSNQDQPREEQSSQNTQRRLSAEFDQSQQPHDPRQGLLQNAPAEVQRLTSNLGQLLQGIRQTRDEVEHMVENLEQLRGRLEVVAVRPFPRSRTPQPTVPHDASVHVLDFAYPATHPLHQPRRSAYPATHPLHQPRISASHQVSGHPLQPQLVNVPTTVQGPGNEATGDSNNQRHPERTEGNEDNDMEVVGRLPAQDKGDTNGRTETS